MPADAFILATRNPHKLREMRRLLAPAGVTVEPLPPEVELPPEDGETFAENALGKARAAAAGTGRPALADDSGIEADALGGAPGVRSARYAGLDATDAENLAKLISEVPVGGGLRYVCELAYVDPDSGEEHVFHGECRGHMAPEPRGSGGFGYDPVFVPEAEVEPGSGADGHGRTMAELSDSEKDAISHRGNAVRAFVEWLGS